MFHDLSPSGNIEKMLSVVSS